MAKKKISLEVNSDEWEMFKKITRVNFSNGTQMLNILMREYNNKRKSDLQGKFDFNDGSKI